MGALQAVMDIRVPFSTKRQPWTGRLQVNGWDSTLNCAYARALIHTAHVIVEHYEGPGADEARCASQIEDGRVVLEEAGLHEYAPGCFARPGCEDPALRALRSAVSAGQVIGVGLGARTRFAGAETVTTGDLDTYLAWSHDFAKITVEARAVKGR